MLVGHGGGNGMKVDRREPPVELHPRRLGGLDLLSIERQPETWGGVANPLRLLPRRLTPSYGWRARLDPDPAAQLARMMSRETRHKFRSKERKLAQLPGYRYLRAATAESPDQTTAVKGVLIAAIQVKGLAATVTLDAIVKSTSTSAQKFTSQTVAGKTVMRFSAGTGTAGTVFDLYAKDDILFYVILFGDTSAEKDVLGNLP